MIQKQILQRAIDSVVGGEGFKRRGATWFLTCPDVVFLIEMRKSDHGNYYYLDCGIIIKSISDNLISKINKCHIQFSMNYLAATEADTIVKGLDIEEATEADLNSLCLLIKKRCLPMLLELSSLSGLAIHYKKDKFKGALLLWQARELIERY